MITIRGGRVMLAHLQFPHRPVMRRLDTEASTACAAPAPHLSASPAAPWRRTASRVTVLALAAVAAACGGKAAGPPTLQQVATLTMRAQPTSLTQEYPAQLEASNTVEIRPQVAGILYRQEQADRDLARVRPLTAIDALSEKELDAAVATNASAKGQVQAAEAAVKTAELNLGYTNVRSPIDGVMSRAQIRIGGVVTAYTTLLTTVYQTDPMYANFSVGEQRLLQVQRELGRPLDQQNPSQRQFRILLADGSEYELPGKMNFVDAAVDLRTDTLALRLTVPNPKQFLHSGQYVRVVVATRERPNALLVPQRAVQLLQDKNYVWIVDSAGKAQQRDVTMGLQQGSDWVVEKGLAPGDVVVVDGTQKLKSGTPVHAQPLVAAAAGPRAS